MTESATSTITVRQATEEYGLAAKTLTEWARLEKIKAHKAGKRWRIDHADLVQYIEENGPRSLPPELDDQATLQRLYRETGSMDALARRLGCAKDTVRKAIHRHGIEVTTRSQAATPPFVPRPVGLKRWMDVAIILLQRGLKPARPEEMCPPNCPGRVDCLDTDHCVLQGNGNGMGRT